MHPLQLGSEGLQSDVRPVALQIWKQIMTNVNQDPVVSANVIFDILNEPDSQGLTWDGTQLDGQGLGYWYHQIMAMGYSINPSATLHATTSHATSSQTPPFSACSLPVWLYYAAVPQCSRSSSDVNTL